MPCVRSSCSATWVAATGAEKLGHPGLEVDLGPVALLQPPFQRPHQVTVTARNEPIEQFDDGQLRAEGGVDIGQGHDIARLVREPGDEVSRLGVATDLGEHDQVHKPVHGADRDL